MSKSKFEANRIDRILLRNIMTHNLVKELGRQLFIQNGILRSWDGC